MGGRGREGKGGRGRGDGRRVGREGKWGGRGRGGERGVRGRDPQEKFDKSSSHRSVAENTLIWHKHVHIH